MHGVVFGYLIYSIVIAAIGIILAAACFQNRMWGARSLGVAILSGVIVEVTYLFSIISTDYYLSSLMASLYFAFIDVMLLGFVSYAYFYTRRRKISRQFQIFYGILGLYGAFDMIVLMINPFREIALHYVERDTPIAHFAYVRLPLYNMHLVYSYVLVIIAFSMILKKTMSVPKEYRSQFIFILAGVASIILVNAIFLYIPDKGIASLIDVSISGYAIVEIICYWTSYQYAAHGMLNHFKNVIFENIGQGLVLFDYEDLLILANERARQLVPSVDYDGIVTFEDFTKFCGISWDWEGHGVHSLQCYPAGRALRCDCSIIRGKNDCPLGRLFVFTDTQMETDPLTGFENFEHFRSFAMENSPNFPYPTTAAVFDINSLAVINARFGREEGDRRIRELSAVMREMFPADTYFVRGEDASLIAVCYQKTSDQVRGMIGNLPEDIQYAVADNKEETVVDAVLTAAAALRNKKLLSHGSSHSELIASLTSALEECDPDTGDHVRRTQEMGQRLAERLNLPDIARSRLSLLCMMHDIGKIGIPLEILNKPGKLDSQEWAIMQSHVQKGYQIAKSSEELSGIADMILHHHERWDGKGYPDGLSKESIPVLSRIISIIDAYDAMTHDRVYRRAMAPADAAAELRRCAGTQFDPLITSEFLEMIREDLERDTEEGEKTARKQDSGKPDSRKPDSRKKQSRESLAVLSAAGRGNDAVSAAGTGNDAVSSADTQSSAAQNGGCREQKKSPIHSLKTGICYTTENLDIIAADDSFAAVTGYPEEELAGKGETVNLSMLASEESRTAFLLEADRMLLSGEPFMAELHLRRRGGEDLYALASFREFFDSTSKNIRYQVMLTDMEDSYTKQVLERMEKDKANVRLDRWEKQFRRDSLTHLLSHEAFLSDLEHALLSGKFRILMLMIDVDNFKQINDARGHAEGDSILIRIAGILTASVRSSDLAGRLGGDEFALALLFSPWDSDSLMKEKAEALYRTLRGETAEACPGVTLSVGAALSGQDGRTAAELYRRADRALYASKQAGKGRMTVDDPVIH